MRPEGTVGVHQLSRDPVSRPVAAVAGGRGQDRAPQAGGGQAAVAHRRAAGVRQDRAGAVPVDRLRAAARARAVAELGDPGPVGGQDRTVLGRRDGPALGEHGSAAAGTAHVPDLPVRHAARPRRCGRGRAGDRSVAGQADRSGPGQGPGRSGRVDRRLAAAQPRLLRAAAADLPQAGPRRGVGGRRFPGTAARLEPADPAAAEGVRRRT